MNKKILFGLSILLIALVTGCTSSDSELPGQQLPDEPEQPPEEPTEDTDNQDTDQTNTEVDREITIEGGPGLTYNVEELNVEQGETIRFNYVHQGGTHDFRIERDGQDVAGTEVYTEEGATESFTYTFEEDGNYMFYCSVGSHRARGMEGNIVLN